uniref:Kazal-like domain-containing protein n=1 Tax=Erpetoichthys calabaricus TaxID=27687 RepID=A0A8C4RPR2_ERPCA
LSIYLSMYKPSRHFCGKYHTLTDCPEEPDLECGEDGNTYKNECQLCFECNTETEVSYVYIHTLGQETTLVNI